LFGCVLGLSFSFKTLGGRYLNPSLLQNGAEDEVE